MNPDGLDATESDLSCLERTLKNGKKNTRTLKEDVLERNLKVIQQSRAQSTPDQTREVSWLLRRTVAETDYERGLRETRVSRANPAPRVEHTRRSNSTAIQKSSLINVNPKGEAPETMIPARLTHSLITKVSHREDTVDGANHWRPRRRVE